MQKSFGGKTLAGLVACFMWCGAALAQQSLVVASYGGQFQDMQRKALFEPFTKATGIKITDVSGVSVAKVKSMVMTGNVEWDVFITSTADHAQLVQSNLLDDIDYSKMDQKVLAELPKNAVQKKVLGTQWTAQVIAYNTKAFPGGSHPQSWADVWNVQKFPGPRIMPAGNYVVNPIEPALLSAGVGKDKVYPLDLNKAYDQLTKLRPQVIRWINSGSAVPQALVDGEAVVGMANSLRIQELKDGGAPVDYVWNEGIVSMTHWALPKGGKNREAALKFLEFVSRVEQQTAMARNSVAPVNQRAFDLLTPQERSVLPSAPENFSKLFVLQTAPWLTRSATGQTVYEENVGKWISWSTRQ
ncbi:MAG TPA: ABC transporter substrate-binding protein [Burkholderiaceae bacterium]|nr:ABC transporter substrate-binding protein [Burkholderiaceae bacterium]